MCMMASWRLWPPKCTLQAALILEICPSYYISSFLILKCLKKCSVFLDKDFDVSAPQIYSLIDCAFKFRIRISSLRQTVHRTPGYTASVRTPVSFMEPQDRAFSRPASYSAGPGFEPRPGDRLSSFNSSWFFSVHPGKFRGSMSALNYNTIASFRIFSIHYSEIILPFGAT